MSDDDEQATSSAIALIYDYMKITSSNGKSASKKDQHKKSFMHDFSLSQESYHKFLKDILALASAKKYDAVDKKTFWITLGKNKTRVSLDPVIFIMLTNFTGKPLVQMSTLLMNGNLLSTSTIWSQ
ncbi:hypothetical protein C8J56DRAFT_881541 [Mycena floridula]|nr:hypothetical protein C8J56DRAFT_881541 [Mycena floridula]